MGESVSLRAGQVGCENPGWIPPAQTIDCQLPSAGHRLPGNRPLLFCRNIIGTPLGKKAEIRGKSTGNRGIYSPSVSACECVRNRGRW